MQAALLNRGALFALVLVLAAVPVPAQGPTAEPTHALTVLSSDLASDLPGGEVVEVVLELRNDGSTTWQAGQGFAIAYHWLDEHGEVVTFEGRRTVVPQPVPQGETLQATVLVETPAAIGTYQLQWDVVQEHVCWISQRDPTPPGPIPVRVRPSHAFTLLEHDTPSWLGRGSEAAVQLRLRNDGLTAWQPGGAFNLSYHWSTEDGEELDWDGLRTAVPSEVLPGAEVTVEARLQAPSRSGRAVLQWDLVHEQVCWFSQRDPTPDPTLRVWVLPGLHGSGLVPALVATALVVALLVFAKRDKPALLVVVLGLADLVWLASSLLLKQAYVLQVADRSRSSGSVWVQLASVAVVILVLALLPRRLRPVLAWLAAAAAAAVILADVVHLRYFGDVISLAAVGAAGQTGHLGGSIGALLEAGDLWMVLDLVPAAVLVCLVVRLQRRTTSRRPALLTAGLMVPLLIPGLVVAVRGATAFDGRMVQVYQNIYLVQDLGVGCYHLRDAVTFVRDQVLQPPLGDERLAEVTTWFEQRAPRRAGSGPYFGVATGRNLLMLQVESLQGYLIGLEVEGQEVTPNLNRLATQMLWFSSCYDQAAQGRSSDSELASQTSLLPTARGAAAFRYASNDFVGLAEILDEQGYFTLSAVPFESAFWNRRVTHPAYGFEQRLFDDAFGPGEVIGWGLNDRAFLAQMVPRLVDAERPFCAYLITLSLHHPFAGFPEHLKRLDVGQHEGTPFGGYLHTMHFFDRAVAELIAALEQEGLLQETVVVIWGDHGSGIYWNRQIAAAIGKPYTEPEFFLSEKVPLLLHVPGMPELRGERSTVAGQMDIAPTLLALLGIDPAPLPFMGRNLLGAPGGEPVVARYGTWVDSELLYANKGPGLDEGNCYTVAPVREVAIDRCHDGNLAAQQQAEITRLVLTYDLQQRLQQVLAGEAGP